MKPSQPARRELTDEEKQQQAIRALLQERKMLVQGIAFNLSGNPGIISDEGSFPDPEEFASFAVAAADAIMKELYTKPEQGEKTEK